MPLISFAMNRRRIMPTAGVASVLMINITVGHGRYDVADFAHSYLTGRTLCKRPLKGMHTDLHWSTDVELVEWFVYLKCLNSLNLY